MLFRSGPPRGGPPADPPQSPARTRCRSAGECSGSASPDQGPTPARVCREKQKKSPSEDDVPLVVTQDHPTTPTVYQQSIFSWLPFVSDRRRPSVDLLLVAVRVDPTMHMRWHRSAPPQAGQRSSAHVRHKAPTPLTERPLILPRAQMGLIYIYIYIYIYVRFTSLPA